MPRLGKEVDKPAVLQQKQPKKAKPKKRTTKSSGKYLTGAASNRYLLLNWATFSESCMGELMRRGWEPHKQKWLPDARWIMETRDNGRQPLFLEMLVSFD